MSARVAPNVVVIVSDDQGYGDLSCAGSTDVHTPQLDQLAASGTRFTSFYANSPVCSPSRASLLTGRYPSHAGVRHILPSHPETPGLPPGLPTLATLLREHGYQTGLVGKWHLGFAPGSRPNDHGFDEWFGLLGGAHDYYSHLNWGAVNKEVVVDGKRGIGFLRHDLWDNGVEAWHNGSYSTELFGERAVAFVRRCAIRGSPFFLYLGFTAPHHPMHVPEEYKNRFPHLPNERRVMAAMLSAMDDQVGCLLDELDRHGIRENTLIFFMSDNGPSRQSRNWLNGRLDPYYGASTGPFRGHKFSLFEGGIRVPAIISWPTRWERERTTDELAVGMDVLPTIAAAIGADILGVELDGRDLQPMLEGGATPHDVVYWEFGRQTAIRRGDWKLVLDGVLIPEEPQADPVHLSNLRDDPGETTNLADRQPEIAEELHRLAASWRNAAEQHWADEHATRYVGPNAYAVTDTAGMALLADPTGPGAGDA